jgi:AcrR family transcriptional regulator
MDDPSATRVRWQRMVRWEPDARGRLVQAAIELFGERGFEATTAHDIAERAGVTERTFFRHFADKREVLFDGAGLLEKSMVNAVASSSEQAPMAVMIDALNASSDVFGDLRAWSTKRAAVIAANPSLQERELLKLSRMSAAMARALVERGTDAQKAAVVADLGVAIFQRTFQRWIQGDDDFAASLRSTLADFESVTRASGADVPKHT